MFKRIILFISLIGLCACGEVNHSGQDQGTKFALEQNTSAEDEQIAANEFNEITREVNETNEELGEIINKTGNGGGTVQPICHDTPNCKNPRKRINRDGHVILVCPKPLPCDLALDNNTDAEASIADRCKDPAPRPCAVAEKQLFKTDSVDFRICPQPEPDPIDPCRVAYLKSQTDTLTLDPVSSTDAIKVCRDDIGNLPPDVADPFFLRLLKRVKYLEAKLDRFYKFYKTLPHRLQKKLKRFVIHWLKNLYEKLEFVKQRLSEDEILQGEIVKVIDSIQEKMIRFARSL